MNFRLDDVMEGFVAAIVVLAGLLSAMMVYVFAWSLVMGECHYMLRCAP